MEPQIHTNRGSRASASTSGVERDPGEVQASVMPQRASSSTNAAIRSWLSETRLTDEPYRRTLQRIEAPSIHYNAVHGS